MQSTRYQGRKKETIEREQTQKQWAQIYHYYKAKNRQYRLIQHYLYQYTINFDKFCRLILAREKQKQEKNPDFITQFRGNQIYQLEEVSEQVDSLTQEIICELQILCLPGLSEIFGHFNKSLKNAAENFITLYKSIIGCFSVQSKLPNLVERNFKCVKCKNLIQKELLQSMLEQMTMGVSQYNEIEKKKLLEKTRQIIENEQKDTGDYMKQKRHFIELVNKTLRQRPNLMANSFNKAYNFLMEYMQQRQGNSLFQNEQLKKDQGHIKLQFVKQEQLSRNKISNQPKKVEQFVEQLKIQLFNEFLQDLSEPFKILLMKAHEKIKQQQDCVENRMKSIREQSSQTLQISQFTQIEYLQQDLRKRGQEIKLIKQSKAFVEKNYLRVLQKQKNIEHQLIALRSGKGAYSDQIKKLREEKQYAEKMLLKQKSENSEQISKIMNNHVQQKMIFGHRIKVLQKQMESLNKIINNSKRKGKLLRDNQSIIFQKPQQKFCEASVQTNMNDQNSQWNGSSSNFNDFPSYSNLRKKTVFLRKQSTKQRSMFKKRDLRMSRQISVCVSSNQNPLIPNEIIRKILQQKIQNPSYTSFSSLASQPSSIAEEEEDQKIQIPEQKIKKQTQYNKKLIKKDISQPKKNKPILKSTSKQNYLTTAHNKKGNKLTHSVNKRNKSYNLQEILNPSMQINQANNTMQQISRNQQLPLKTAPDKYKRGSKVFINRIARDSDKYRNQKLRVRKIAGMLKPYQNKSRFNQEKQKKSQFKQAITTNKEIIANKPSFAYKTQRNLRVCTQGDDMIHQSSEKQYDALTSKNTLEIKQGNRQRKIQAAKMILQKQYAYLKAIGMIDFLQDIQQNENKPIKLSKNHRKSIASMLPNMEISQNAQLSIQLFGNQVLASQYQKNKGIWKQIIDSSSKVLDLKTESFANKIDKYFKLFEKINRKQYQHYCRFLANPSKYCEHQYKKMENFQIQKAISGKFFIRNTFLKLIRFHKMQHQDCDHITNFLGKIGYYKYVF